MTQIETQDAVLEEVQKKFGFVPNLIREMAKSPAALEVYLKGNQVLEEKGTLKPAERQAVLLTVSARNKCDYCQAAHSMGAKKSGVSPADVEAIRLGRRPSNARLASLVAATQLIFDKRGWLEESELKTIENSGIDRAQIYELVAIIAVKTVSNYINHINHTELDPQLRG